MPAATQRLDAIEQRFNIGRREFLSFCAAITATMGLPGRAVAEVAEAIVSKSRPSVIWLHHQECTGCTELFLRAEHPTLEKLILEIISLDYHETLFAAAGHQIEAAKRAAMEKNKGKYLLVVEGAIPTKDGGIYCKIGGKTSLELTREAAENAAAVIALGSCASWGACLRLRQIQPVAPGSARRWAARTFSLFRAVPRTRTIFSPASCTS